MNFANPKQGKSLPKRQGPPAGGISREVADSDDLDRGKIDHVLGMTVFSNSSLACHSNSGLVAYPAGSVLILLDCLRNRQVSSIHTPRKMITAVCFSPDGKLIATGESGHQPSVRVWRLSSMSEIATLNGHHVGISCVSFTRQMSAIVIVGDAYDMVISVWSWPEPVMLSLNKFGDKVYAMDISSDGDFFVTVGNRHVKFYCMEILKSSPFLISKGLPVPLPTRVGTLDSFKDSYFCDVACGLGRWTHFIYVISSSGILCQMNRDRMLERWVDINVTIATCLARDEEHIFVGCDGGVVKMFRAFDLNIVLTLPRPHSLGLDIAEMTEFGEPVPESRGDCLEKPKVEYPTVRAMAYDCRSHQLTVIYDDRSIYIWRRKTRNGLYSFRKCYSSLYHCGCIWDLTLYPLSEESCGGALPPGALISVSADGTLRAWDVASIISEKSMLKRNAVSTNCLKIVYSEADQETGRGKAWQMKRIRGDPMSPAFQRECRQCFGVVAVCPEGLHIATGNRCGRVMVYDAHSMKLIATRFAHDTEITALSYTATNFYKILASGSRDRMIHLMDASNDYQLLSTLDDHSSSITTIQFTYISQCLLMVSSSLDMSVLVRAYLDNTPLVFSHVRAIVEKKAVMDFTMHPWSGQIALVCQDKLVRIYSLLNSQKSNNSYKGCPPQGGSLIKICVDPSGQYLLTACTNKTINLIEFNTGEILHTFCGHAESITRIRFSHNLRHVISSASDGCIFMWKLPQTVAYSVKKVMAEMGLLTRGMVLNKRWAKRSNGKRVQNALRSTMTDTSEEMAEETRVDCTKSCSVPATLKGGKGCKEVKRTNDDLHDPLASPEVVKPDSDETHTLPSVSSRTTERLDKTSKILHPLIVKKDRNNVEWLQNCTQRRQLFKVEAKSIKRILSMMRLVADAMERDLIDAAASSVSDDMSLLQEALGEREETKVSDNGVHLGTQNSSGATRAHKDKRSFAKASLPPPRKNGRKRARTAVSVGNSSPTLSNRDRRWCVEKGDWTTYEGVGDSGSENMLLASDVEQFISNKPNTNVSKCDILYETSLECWNGHDVVTHPTQSGCALASEASIDVSEGFTTHVNCSEEEEDLVSLESLNQMGHCGTHEMQIKRAHGTPPVESYNPEPTWFQVPDSSTPPRRRKKKKKMNCWTERGQCTLSYTPTGGQNDVDNDLCRDTNPMVEYAGWESLGEKDGGPTVSKLPRNCSYTGECEYPENFSGWQRRSEVERPEKDAESQIYHCYYSLDGKAGRYDEKGLMVSTANAMPITKKDLLGSPCLENIKGVPKRSKTMIL